MLKLMTVVGGGLIAMGGWAVVTVVLWWAGRALVAVPTGSGSMSAVAFWRRILDPENSHGFSFLRSLAKPTEP